MNIRWGESFSYPMMVGVLKVSARTRLASFELVLEFAVASWCLEALKDVSSVWKEDKFVRKFRGSNFVVMMEKNTKIQKYKGFILEDY